MSSSHERLKLLGIVCSFIILFAFYPVFMDESFAGGQADRYRDGDAANEDSLIILWEAGTTTVNLDGDFRLATIGIGLLLFVSIFATLIIHFSNGGNDDE